MNALATPSEITLVKAFIGALGVASAFMSAHIGPASPVASAASFAPILAC